LFLSQVNFFNFFLTDDHDALEVINDRALEIGYLHIDTVKKGMNPRLWKYSKGGSVEAE